MITFEGCPTSIRTPQAIGQDEATHGKGEAMRPNENTHTVFVNDNFHYQDESERYTLGQFMSYEKAVQAARRVVDEFLKSAHEPKMSPEQLFRQYTTFGDDPYVVPDDGEPGFSAWTYAEQRCRIICKAR